MDTQWTRRLKLGEQPTEADLRDHLLVIHRQHAGFTESCATRCRDEAGLNSYEILADAVRPSRDRRVVDLACGSGVLTEMCHRRFGPAVELIGVDMSSDELSIAKRRLPDNAVELHQGLAQNLEFIRNSSVDVVLCHWALTLMDPVVPVLREVRRVLRTGGRFAAIIDGELSLAPGYDELHRLIYGWVQRECPAYGNFDLGDPRVRSTDSLLSLVTREFDDAKIAIEPSVMSLRGPSRQLAEEAVGFFYASFVLSPGAHAAMLDEVTQFFETMSDDTRRFAMPINRLTVSPAFDRDIRTD